jgi:hypothetical protein
LDEFAVCRKCLNNYVYFNFFKTRPLDKWYL